MYDRANKVDNVLGTGASLDEMPSDLGLAGVAGTLDAEGNTADGTPAPIPGPAELKAAMIKAAFDTQKGDPPQLVEVQTPSTGGSAYYALSVEDVTPPAAKPFDAVKEQVTADWTRDAQRHAQEEAAAKLLAAVKGGQSLADAAAVAGVTVRRTPLVTRGSAAEGMPPQLATAAVRAEAGRADDGGNGDGFHRRRAGAKSSRPIRRPIPPAMTSAHGGARVGRQRSRQRLRRRVARSAPIRASISPVLDNVTGQPAMNVTVPPGFAAFRAAYDAGRGSAGVAARRGRPGNAGRGVPEAGARPAELVPAGKRGGRRGARPLFDHRHGARPDLALPRRPRRDQPPCALGAARLRARRRGRRWTACARLIAETRLDVPANLPPMAGGLVGYLGYDMVRLMERLPAKNARRDRRARRADDAPDAVRDLRQRQRRADAGGAGLSAGGHHRRSRLGSRAEAAGRRPRRRWSGRCRISRRR